MPKEDGKKIKSEPSNSFLERKSSIAKLFLIITITAIVVIAYFVSKNNYCSGVVLKSGCYTLERAETNYQRASGLSDRDSLAKNQAMLFVFESADEHCIWMKDMRFDIDIIWLDKYKSILKVLSNVSPSTYPESFCYKNTVYVIELNAGQAKQNNLEVGSVLNF